MIDVNKLREVASKHRHIISCYKMIVEENGDKFILWNRGAISVGAVMEAVIAKDGSAAWVSNAARYSSDGPLKGQLIGSDALMVKAILADLGLSEDIIKEDERIYWDFDVSMLR